MNSSFARRLLCSVGLAAPAALVAWCAMTAHQAHKATSHLATRLAANEARLAETAAIADLADRIIDLPQDQGAWFTSIFTSDAWKTMPAERRVVDWFARDPDLSRLKAQTHFHHYTPANSLYDRYTGLTATGIPAVVVQDAAGQVVFKASGSNLPEEPGRLVRAIRDAVRARCPELGPCPKPTPPSPVAPDPDGKPSVPDIGGSGTVPPAGHDETLAVTALAFVVALAVGFVAAARRQGSLTR